MRTLLIVTGVVTSGLVALAGVFLGAVILADTAFGSVEGQKKLATAVDRHRTYRTLFRLVGLIGSGDETAPWAR